MTERKLRLTFILTAYFAFCILSVGVAQNTPFGESTTVTTPQSTSGAFDVSIDTSRTQLAIDRSWVNVRSGPGTSHSILDCLPQGSKGTLVGEKDGWYQIDFGNGLIGYVRSDLVADVTPAAPSAPSQPASSSLAQENAKQFERWNRHLGNDLLDYSRFPWYWRLGRARRAFERGNYQSAYKLAQRANGNAIEAAYMQAMCLDKMGEHQQANNILKNLERHFEDRVFNKMIDKVANPYIREPVVFKFGGYDDIETYQKKKAAGNRIGLNSGEYYERFVDINTWQWRSAEAHREFNSIAGIDCSGFVQMLQKETYKQAGVQFPITSRTSTSGLWSGKYANEINPGYRPPPPPDIRPGDMILLDYGHNRFGHSMIYKGVDAQGNIVVVQMGDTAEVNILSPEKFQYYKGTYRMNGMDEVRKTLTA